MELTPKLTFIEWLEALKNNGHFYINSRIYVTFYFCEIERKKKAIVI